MSFPTDPLIFNQAKYMKGIGFDFTAGTGLWLLVDRTTWTPDPDDDYIADILIAGAVEPATTGDRQTILTPTVTLDDAGDQAVWGCGDFSYPGIPNLSTFDTAVLVNFVTTDSDSWLIYACDLGALVGDGGSIAMSLASPGVLIEWP